MFILHSTIFLALLFVLYWAYRTLMHSETRAIRVMANVIGGFFAVFLCAFTLIIRPMVFDSAVIVSDSMLPTLDANERVFSTKLTYRNGEPRFGDVITFRFPSQTQGTPDEILAKRVIGLPGDTIEVADGSVFRNRQRLDEPYILKPMQYTMPPVTVPAGKLFVLGDNRNESDDSHIWGLLDRDRVVGRVTLRFYPLSRLGYVR